VGFPLVSQMFEIGGTLEAYNKDRQVQFFTADGLAD
jgi:hypothetical protein